MKRYWPLLIMGAVIFATFGMHYMQIVRAADQTAITFETLLGDESHMTGMTLSGQLTNGFNYHNILLQDEKVEQRSHYSIYEAGNDYYIEQLIANYKNFMRGKMTDANRFYEDDTHLVYVEEAMNSWELAVDDPLPYQIEILNKKDHTVHSFHVTGKLPSIAFWITLEQVQLIDNKIKLVMRYVKGQGNEELHLVTIDVKTETLLEDQLLETVTSNEKGRSTLNIYSEYFNRAPKKYLLYFVNSYSAHEESTASPTQEFKVLNLATNTVFPIDIPQQLFGDRYLMLVVDHHLVIAAIADGELAINRYNIGQQQWAEPLLPETQSGMLPQNLLSMHSSNGIIYLYVEADAGQVLYAIDTFSGNLLYKGLVHIAGKESDLSFTITHIFE